ncbi:MAG TPA: enoyl-CoA hydratase-related protein, partial [Dehalococcoidia bacterium]|nr:enoyl-CoA hydratase-related protein [Dehalococcoidia bacterium]
MADVNFERRGDGIAWITLNRPESLNAMGGQLLPLLGQYLDDCVHDRSVRCVVLTGAGRAFCAGGDVKAMASGGQVIGTEASEPKSLAGMVQARVEGLREQQRKTSGVLHTMPKPTIAAVNGHAVGAGLSLALACDVRIASENAKLGTVFRNVGFSGDFGGSWFLPRLVGIEMARKLYFTGEILTAEEAQRIGMVSKVVPHDQLEAETMALATQLAAGPTLAYARMKENLIRSATSDL